VPERYTKEERTRGKQVSFVEEGRMKSNFLKTFLAGAAFGVGATVLVLYTRNPGFCASSLQALADAGRARKAKREKNKYLRKRLRGMGFSDKEIDQNL
jgi:hypothetical protein